MVVLSFFPGTRQPKKVTSLLANMTVQVYLIVPLIYSPEKVTSDLGLCGGFRMVP